MIFNRKLTRATVGESALRNLASSLCEESFLNLNDEDDESGDELLKFTGQQREKGVYQDSSLAQLFELHSCATFIYKLYQVN